MTDHRKTAVYIRLSAEDDNVDGRAKKESDSVTSQRILLKSFVIDQLGVDEADILEYVDDGVSGTHFKRQGFQQLQEDMKSGEIGCVVVKDFSRFGRDYLEVGFYIEYIFPLLQIRFISINDSYDSAASSGMTGGMNVALQNLVYNMYSLDLSKKISSAMQTRTKNGTRLPVNARYGYKKGKDGRLEVDPEAAKVVKMIFQMAAEGTSFADITRELNRQAIATCDEQKLSRGDQVQFQRFDTIKKKHWSPTTVAAIVRDEIYIGTRIWGKTRCSMHTGHKAVLNDETEWVRLENHHTAIIDRALFEKANDILGYRITDIMFNGTDEDLRQTKVTQPAVFLHSVISALCMGDDFKPEMTAGHSLGEFSALVAAGALSFEDGLKLVYARAMAMQKACEAQPSTMAAIIALPDEKVEEICAQVSAEGEVCVAANYNCPGQIVISGSIEGINKACELMKAAGAKRALPLKVGGAFHSPLMDPAKVELEAAINATDVHAPKCPVYQNVDALPHTDPAEIKKNLVAQLTASVRWTQTVKNMVADGATDFTECGPGAVLLCLVK